VFEVVRYDFTAAELKDLGGKLAHAAQGVFDLQREKASVVANFGASLKAANDTVQDLVLKITNRCEERMAECIVRLDSPRPGQKEFVRVDTGEVVRVAAMTADDLQQRLPLGEDKRVQ
jgi:uncharacterized FAD-dependent dehydrogenase